MPQPKDLLETIYLQQLEMETLHYVIAACCVILVLVFLCRQSSACKYTIKYALYHLYMVFIFTIAIIPCCFRPGKADNVVVGRYIYHASRFVWWLFGIDIVTEGIEILDSLKAPAVFMCNHQSSLDALVIAKVDPLLI